MSNCAILIVNSRGWGRKSLIFREAVRFGDGLLASRRCRSLGFESCYVFADCGRRDADHTIDAHDAQLTTPDELIGLRDLEAECVTGLADSIQRLHGQPPTSRNRPHTSTRACEQ